MRFIITKSGHLERLDASAASPAAAGEAPATAAEAGLARRTAAERAALRGLWEDHAAWTRLMIVSTMSGLADLEATTRRLLRSPADLAAALSPRWGEAGARRLGELLRSHVLGTGAVLAAVRARDAARLEDVKQAWYANADELASALSRATKGRRPLADLRSAVHRTLDLTLAEALDQLEGRFAASVERHDQLREAFLGLADVIGEGLPGATPGLA